MWHVVLNEEVQPEPHETEAQASAEGRRLAAAFEAEAGSPACWFVADLPAEH